MTNWKGFWEKILKDHLTAYFITLGLAVHSIYWLTAWWSPIPFLLLNIGAALLVGPLKLYWRAFWICLTFPKIGTRILLVAVPFVIANWIALFACLFMFGTVNEDGCPIEGTWKHFYFSAMTFFTVGYGNIVPHGFIAELFATIEALVGVVLLGLALGLIATVVVKRLNSDEPEN